MGLLQHFYHLPRKSSSYFRFGLLAGFLCRAKGMCVSAVEYPVCNVLISVRIKRNKQFLLSRPFWLLHGIPLASVPHLLLMNINIFFPLSSSSLLLLISSLIFHIFFVFYLKLNKTQILRNILLFIFGKK